MIRKIFIFAGIISLLLAGLVIYLIIILGQDNHIPVWAINDSDAGKGKTAILMYGCYACHVIPDIRAGKGRVGPKLKDIERQIYIGGVLTNSPSHMINWIRNPQEYSPNTAMPDLDVDTIDARNITAYLFNSR
jgi:cytochrome c2